MVVSDVSLADRAGPVARTLATAAAALDAPAMAGVLRRSIDDRGVVVTWDELIRPALRALGQLPDRGGHSIAVEHLLSRAVCEAFAAVPRPPVRRPVGTLLACAAAEDHTLPLHAVAAALAEAGADCCFLGARTPTTALNSAIRRIGPAVVVVWSQIPATANPEHLPSPVAARAGVRCVAATGPGWKGTAVPPDVHRPVDLAQTVALVLAHDRDRV
jgi:hypothetical protein